MTWVVLYCNFCFSISLSIMHLFIVIKNNSEIYKEIYIYMVMRGSS